jgi:hypothetical protein
MDMVAGRGVHMGEMLMTRSIDGRETRFLLEISRQGDHWVSTLSRFAPGGELESVQVAPRFYGTTEEQARRRMITVLENQYDEVQSLGGIA